MIKKRPEHNEFCTWCEEELSDYDKVYTDIEGNSYCCENCLDNGILVLNATRKITKAVLEG